MSNTETDRNRDREGRYTFEDAPCRCGHSLGTHTAERSKGQQPCLAGELEGEPCDCQVFKPRKAS